MGQRGSDSQLAVSGRFSDRGRSPHMVAGSATRLGTKINHAYNVVGNGLLWPIRAARKALQGEPIPPMDDYRIREWAAILTVVEELFDKLRWMASSGNDIIRPRIEALLQGDSQLRIISTLREKHAVVQFDEELREIVDVEMLKLQAERPDLFKIYSQINHVSAAVRPVTSIVMFSIGFGPAGELVSPILATLPLRPHSMWPPMSLAVRQQPSLVKRPFPVPLAQA